jgi:hypothetical protein
LRRKQVDAQPRGTDGIGFVDDLVAAAVVALQRLREGEGEEKSQDAERRALGQVDVRTRRLVGSFLAHEADSIARLDRHHGGRQQAENDPAGVDVVHQLFHDTPLTGPVAKKAPGRPRCVRIALRTRR